MANQLETSIRYYLHSDSVSKRYVRISDLADSMEFVEEDVLAIAKAAGALYKLSRIVLIHRERFDGFMKHIYKVPETNKQVVKKFARIGECSMIYSIGRHRIVEMARAAGATYKIGEGQGNTVLINLELFDEYMEQFRQSPVPMRQNLNISSSGGDTR